MKNRFIPIFAFMALFLSSCISDYEGGPFFGESIKGEGPVTTGNLEVEGFTEVGLKANADYFLSQGDSYGFRVEGQQNIIDNLEAEVKDNTLAVGFKKKVSSFKSLKIYITLPRLEAIHLAGSGEVAGETPFTGMNKLSLNIAGSGNISLEAETQSVEASIAGSGDISMKGKAQATKVNIMGSGSFNSPSFSTTTADLSIAGSGDCTLDVGEKLDVSIAGSGDVVYTGSPKVSKSIAGSGDVRKK